MQPEIWHVFFRGQAQISYAGFGITSAVCKLVISATRTLLALESMQILQSGSMAPCASFAERRQSGATASTSCRRSVTLCRGKGTDVEDTGTQDKRRWFDLQDLLGPIGLALQSGKKAQVLLQLFESLALLLWPC